MNAKQTAMVDQFKALSDAYPNESSVTVKPIERLKGVVVQLTSEGEGKFPAHTSATFVLGARGGIKYATYRHSPFFSDSEHLEGKAAVSKIKQADIWIFSKY